ncbi:hypothetical protein OTSTA763_1739 [Orientia tsutsugamushi str. TA763]|nr:hypothetical protein OTSTA763_1739 [Orientia tsutsugamushi str. TA763]
MESSASWSSSRNCTTLNSRHAKLGLAFMVGGIALCYCFKKFKKVSENFLLKSFLVAKGLLPAPLGYSRLLAKSWQIMNHLLAKCYTRAVIILIVTFSNYIASCS